jgi:lactoylglutathione lyase
MQQQHYRDMPDKTSTNAFLSFGPENMHCSMELTYNYGTDKYNLGDGFGHLATATTDIHGMYDKIKAGGGEVCLSMLNYSQKSLDVAMERKCICVPLTSQ